MSRRLFGAWLGGIAIDATGSYDWMWYADIVLAALASAGEPAYPGGGSQAGRSPGVEPARTGARRRWRV